MNKVLTFVLLFLACLLPGKAATHNVTPASNLQSVISGSVVGDIVQFGPGQYDLSSGLTLTCGVSYLGPVISNFVPGSNSQTAVLVGSSNNFSIFNLAGGCTSPTTIEWLGFQTANAIYVGGGVSNLTIEYNSGTNFAAGNEIFLDGDITDTSNNINIQYNAMGDANSCSAFMGYQDDDNCDGILNHAGNVTGLNIQHNYFYHVQEPVHLVQICTGCQSGNTVSVCNGCTIQYNYVDVYARIGFEIQTSNIGSTDVYSDNVILNPTQSNAFGMSLACCLSGRTYGSTLSTVPADFADDNVIIVPASAGIYEPFGIEWWGLGATANGNMIEGLVDNAVAIGFFNYPSTTYGIVENNFFCGIPVQNGGYFTNEEYGNGGVSSQATTPTNLIYGANGGPFTINGGNNQTAITCTQQPSTAATISPAAGAQAFPLTVTLSTAGRNTSVYYTTDGSTPTPGSGTTQFYSGPFTLNSAATVKAVGMWGVPPQPTSYTAPYGYIPSGIASAQYTGSGTTETAAATPTFSVPTGTYTTAQTVTIADTTPGATIYFTQDGTTPTTGSPVYSRAVNVSATETLQALAVASGYLNSAVASETLTITPSTGSTDILVGNQLDNSTTGVTYAGAYNSLYVVVPSGVGTLKSCLIDLTTRTVVPGVKTECVVVAAISTTTQATTALCSGTYTNPAGSTTGPGVVTIPLSGCNVTPGEALFIDTDTNGSGAVPLGFGNCGGTCGATVPPSGSGTFHGEFALATFGATTNLSPTMVTNPNQPQPTIYLDFAVSGGPLPIIGGFVGSPNNLSTITSCPTTVQFIAYGCTGANQTQCTADTNVSWNSSSPGVGSITAGGLFTALFSGQTSIYAQPIGTSGWSGWTMTIAIPSSITTIAPGTHTVTVAPCGSGTVSGTGLTVQ